MIQYRRYIARRSTSHLKNRQRSNAGLPPVTRKREHISGRKIAALKEKLEGCKQKYAVYCDILETYDRLSKRDYVAELVEEERQRKEQKAKKSGRNADIKNGGGCRTVPDKMLYFLLTDLDFICNINMKR